MTCNLPVLSQSVLGVFIINMNLSSFYLFHKISEKKKKMFFYRTSWCWRCSSKWKAWWERTSRNSRRARSPWQGGTPRSPRVLRGSYVSGCVCIHLTEITGARNDQRTQCLETHLSHQQLITLERVGEKRKKKTRQQSHSSLLDNSKNERWGQWWGDDWMFSPLIPLRFDNRKFWLVGYHDPKSHTSPWQQQLAAI